MLRHFLLSLIRRLHPAPVQAPPVADPDDIADIDPSHDPWLTGTAGLSLASCWMQPTGAPVPSKTTTPSRLADTQNRRDLIRKNRP